MEQNSDILIVGLGNPGKNYENTRHNFGFRIVKALANKAGVSFRSRLKLQGDIAQMQIGDQRIYLLMPMTYMNRSGSSVINTMSYYKVPVDKLLVVSDDIELKFGELRLREKGSSGGHNGLKDIAEKLATTNYVRLRGGIGKSEQIALETFVLQRFTEEEEEQMPKIIDKSIGIIERFCQQGIQKAYDYLSLLDEEINNGKK